MRRPLQPVHQPSKQRLETTRREQSAQGETNDGPPEVSFVADAAPQLLPNQENRDDRVAQHEERAWDRNWNKEYYDRGCRLENDRGHHDSEDAPASPETTIR